MDTWEHYSHDADIGVRGTGPDLASAFAQAALALTAIVTDPDKIETSTSKSFSLESPNDELLFVDWLNEIIYLMSTCNMLFSRFDLEISDHHLKAIISGEPINRQKHQPTVEPKGATYTTLKIERLNNGQWMAQTVIDV